MQQVTNKTYLYVHPELNQSWACDAPDRTAALAIFQNRWIRLASERKLGHVEGGFADGKIKEA